MLSVSCGLLAASRQACGMATVPNNLPLELTSFIGREREAAEVARLLAEAPSGSRLLTLTGAGGCGKTRLALRVAQDSLGVYSGGVWLVDLAPLTDPELVPLVVAGVLGVQQPPGHPPVDALADYLRPRSALLVLDNCEHLVTASGQLAEAILRSCPRLRILATSRAVLGAHGETTWRVPSLAVPPAPSGAGSSVDLFAGSEAVRLFLDRAAAVRSDLAPTDQSLWSMSEICRRLDGIPLAIELAAARLNVLSVEQIAARLDDCFGLLTGGQRTAMPRHQTLRATVDWSYGLLSEPERALLRRLSVFAGGWTLEAAERVGGGEGIEPYAVLDLLSLLIDKSLVMADQQRRSLRYRLLETIRQYAFGKLGEMGEVERTRARHLDYVLRLAEDAEPKLRLTEQPIWAEQLAAEHDNLGAALEWGLTADRTEAALRLSGALAWFWWLRGTHDEGRRWLTRALAAAPERSTARVRALHGAGWLAHHQRDSATARALLDESLSIARETGDRWSVAWVLHLLGRVAYFENDPLRTRALAEDSLAIAEELSDDWLIAWALHLFGLAAYISADYPAARAYYAQSLEIRQRIGYQEGVTILLQLLGIAAFREGDFVQARERSRELLAAMRGHPVAPWLWSQVFAVFTGLAAAQAQPERAARLAGATAVLGETYHTRPIPMAEALLTEGLARASAELDEAGYAAAWGHGRRMSVEESIADALAVEVDVPSSPDPLRLGTHVKANPAGLTPTEIRVLRLLANGRTTREIAEALVVAISTVDRHLTHIYTKLGVRNRAAAASFAVKQGLV
ncbi:MAG: tetratricopeptide repeat protein [Chloroflexi bacterium]|nr:tetratricopeptide repeat protein [Chloroflexota bacterium]